MRLVKDVLNRFYSFGGGQLLTGLAVLLMNVGGKYVDWKFSRSQQAFLKGALVRELFIFAACWMATRNLVISILLTAAFMILANYLFNEQSKLCVLPAKYRNLDKILDANKDGIVTDTEIAKAKLILEKANAQERQQHQAQALSYLASNAI
jgi:hypothetical protein